MPNEAPTPAPAGVGGPTRPDPGGHDHDTLFIDGTWRSARGKDRIAVQDSGTEAILGRIRSASDDDVDLAVDAARRALRSWASTTPEERAGYLDAIYDHLVERADEMVGLVAAEVGTAVRIGATIQIKSGIDVLANTARLAREHRFEESIGGSTVVHEPVGVVAAVTPWNYPLFQSMAKVAAALSAGCTVVHKPSGLAPLTAFVVAEACASAGLPDGVFNLVTGSGSDVGETLVRHPHVDMISFTGSTETGVGIYTHAAKGMKRLALELGGKSASVILDDADVPLAVKTSVNRAFLNSGQTCDAWTRLLVPASKLAEVLDLVLAGVDRLTVGDPFDPATRLGPLVSAAQVSRVRGYIDGAIRDGATLVAGDAVPPSTISRGYYVRPAVLTDVTPTMAVAREEIFGPVLVVMTYEDEAQAVEIANSTDYGLSAAVWSADPERADRFARQMRAGQVVVNGAAFNPAAPVGGVKMSGIGRELGRYGIAEYLETKAINR